MQEALKEAKKALRRKEVPVGAVIVCGEEIIARGYNTKERRLDPLGHAEILTLQRASQRLGRWRLSDCTMYVTLEPCVMCAGAIVNARLGRLVYGCVDSKAGAIESLYSIANDSRLNHRVAVSSGAMADECSALLKGFFKSLRGIAKEDL